MVHAAVERESGQSVAVKMLDKGFCDHEEVDREVRIVVLLFLVLPSSPMRLNPCTNAAITVMQCAASGKWPQCSAGVIAAVVTIVGTGSAPRQGNDPPLAMLEQTKDVC